MVGLPTNIPAYIYIYHMRLNFNLPVLPDAIQETTQVNFNSEQILGRTAPQFTFSNAGPRTIQVSLKLHRQLFCIENPHIKTEDEKYYMNIVDPSTGKLTEVLAKDAADLFITALQTLSLPKYQDTTKAIIPPTLMIRFGNESSIRGVPSAFSKNASGVWLNSGKMSEVSLAFTITEVEPFSAQYIAQHGSLREISTDLRRGSVWQ